ncbi:retrotransposon protein [Cucumis melo var. makuwa]|uniref:Retrotransposon protein n=1 Tax=Cucumis melo var. makuwa TaxID=1194695 RepID=A0A5A7TEG2_CUCMM|nr:retrotransposon protein [Cucumis melo var. makuwa]
MKQVTIPIKGMYQKNEPPIKRLSVAEFCARLDKGLCFRCNEKYSHDHKCKVKEKRELMLFLLNEEEGTSKENSGEIVELKHLDIAEGFELKTIMDLSSKGTVRLKVVLMDNEVVVLRGVRGLVRFVLKLNPH